MVLTTHVAVLDGAHDLQEDAGASGILGINVGGVSRGALDGAENLLLDCLQVCTVAQYLWWGKRDHASAAEPCSLTDCVLTVSPLKVKVLSSL
jgi:hypothetical protein